MIAAIALLCSGCAALTAPETFVACRAVDTVTTLQIVHHGGTELNPIARMALRSTPVFIGLQVAVSALAWHYWPQMDDSGRAAVNTISCIPAIHNVGQLRGEP